MRLQQEQQIQQTKIQLKLARERCRSSKAKFASHNMFDCDNLVCDLSLLRRDNKETEEKLAKL